MKPPPFLLWTAVAIGLLAAGIGVGSVWTARSGAGSVAEIDRAIQRAQGYLVRACQPDGRFIYQVDSRTGRVMPQYNVLRHTGAVCALEAADAAHPDPATRAAVARACRFLEDRYTGPARPQGAGEPVLAVWTQPLGSVPVPFAVPGAAALGIEALAARAGVEPVPGSRVEAEKIGRFLLLLLRDDGGFAARYSDEAGPTGENTVVYYPGEAVLAFVSLNEADPSGPWLSAAGRILAALARSRNAVPDDCWTLLATARFLPYYDASHCPVSRAELVDHAGRICGTILSQQVGVPAFPLAEGAFDSAGDTSTAATHVEALLAALSVLPEGDSLRPRIAEAARRGTRFLLRTQIVRGPYAGGMPQLPLASADPDAAAIRIDGVAHALAVFLRYRQFLNPTLPKALSAS